MRPFRLTQLFGVAFAGLTIAACERASSSSERTFAFPDEYIARAESLQSGDSVPSVPTALRAGMVLSIQPDSVIAAHLTQHVAAFDSIAALFRKRAQSSPVNVLAAPTPEERDGAVVPADRNAKIQALLDSVGAASVFDDDRYPDCLFVRVSGMGSAQVGYLFVPKGARAPSTRGGTFVTIRPIAGGWYLYKAL